MPWFCLQFWDYEVGMRLLIEWFLNNSSRVTRCIFPGSDRETRQNRPLLDFLRKLTFDADLQVAATFCIGNVRHSRFAADADAKFERHFADFGGSFGVALCANRDTLKGIECRQRLGSNRVFDHLKILRNCLLGFVCK